MPVRFQPPSSRFAPLLLKRTGNSHNPDIVNTEPYAAGWLLRVRIEDPSELEDLISEEEYAELTTEV